MNWRLSVWDWCEKKVALLFNLALDLPIKSFCFLTDSLVGFLAWWIPPFSNVASHPGSKDSSFFSWHENTASKQRREQEFAFDWDKEMPREPLQPRWSLRGNISKSYFKFRTNSQSDCIICTSIQYYTKELWLLFAGRMWHCVCCSRLSLSLRLVPCRRRSCSSRLPALPFCVLSRAIGHI